MRRLLIALTLCAGCAGTPGAPSVCPDPGTDAAGEAHPAEPHRQSGIWLRQREETARADLARIPDLASEDARRLTLARIHRLSPDTLEGLGAPALARLSPTVLRVYRIREALDEGPDSPLAGTEPIDGWGCLDGRDRRARRLAGLIRESLPAERWSPDGSFLFLLDSDLVILQRQELFADIEAGLDRHVSSSCGSIRLRVDLIPDGEDFAEGLGFSRHTGGRKAWLPRAPAKAVAGHRLASVRLDVPWGRRVGAHGAPGVMAPTEGPADSGDRSAPTVAPGDPGLTVLAVRLAPPVPGDPTEHFDLEIVWRASASTVAREVSRHRTTVAVRPDLPALLVWPDGPGAILWVSHGPHTLAKPRPAWCRLLP